MTETLRVDVLPEDGGTRLDTFLALKIEGFSRGRATDHITAGHVRLFGRDGLIAPGKVKPSYLLNKTLSVEVDVQPRPQMSAQAEDIALVIVYEDDDVLVVDKPAGLVVHPALGHEHGTLVNALLHHAPEVEGLGDEYRPGLVHRIDKDTSGLLVVSKNEHAMKRLAAAFAHHDLERRYAAIVLGNLPDDTLTIKTLHARHPMDRKRFSGRVTHGKEAVTHLQVLARSPLTTLVVCTLETGRSHQIRMHLAERGHPIAGDSLYGGLRSHAKTVRTIKDIAALQRIERQALHAYALGFQHPRTGERMRFQIGWPADLLPIAEALYGDAARLPGLDEPMFRGK
jgi:23S rRNA pseudouridine1911/1915/1917 synthase